MAVTRLRGEREVMCDREAFVLLRECGGMLQINEVQPLCPLFEWSATAIFLAFARLDC